MNIILLAGGSGTRLWPLSHSDFPKQFVKLKGMPKTIFQMTVDRCLKLAPLENVYVVTNRSYAGIVHQQIEQMGFRIPAPNVLVEPSSKNTLPAIAYAAQHIHAKGNQLALVLPSDHIIEDDRKFADRIELSLPLTDQRLVIYGIKPSKPHSGYGYIKPGDPDFIGFRVEEFKEKPSEALAAELILEGCLWNSGIFAFQTGVFLEELKEHCPDVYDAFLLPSVQQKYENTPGISIDYGVMERSRRVSVVPMDVRWNDLGSFDSFFDEYRPDENGNITFSDEVLIDSTGNLVYLEQDRNVALIGVDDLIIVEKDNFLLICKKSQSQKVKDIVQQLKLRAAEVVT
ncbi:mannose-1-phosphate guanylyltransferase [Cohnella algarum]|uniref:mannose-1-phosphate guanylyltransferase n=1 Tax=Cohnella algarum TaxID=2044859 RepID=UPI001968001B|nr:mannose-1-phosphate guanylyltransferase [Cohnella algarum]MBN2980279.1 mannose-1-phosphate guanylyltransferase [Cohnella algarum]